MDLKYRLKLENVMFYFIFITIALFASLLSTYLFYKGAYILSITFFAICVLYGKIMSKIHTDFKTKMGNTA